MLNHNTIVKLQDLLEKHSKDRSAVLYAAGIPKELLSRLDVEGEPDVVIMRLGYLMDDWRSGLVDEFQKNLDENPLFKPKNSAPDRQKWPILEFIVWDGELIVTGVWGPCASHTLRDMEESIAGSFDKDANYEMRVQVTGYVKAETEGPYVTVPGYYEYDIISQKPFHLPKEKEEV